MPQKSGDLSGVYSEMRLHSGEQQTFPLPSDSLNPSTSFVRSAEIDYFLPVQPLEARLLVQGNPSKTLIVNSVILAH